MFLKIMSQLKKNLNGLKCRLYFLFCKINFLFKMNFFFLDRLCEVHPVKKKLETQKPFWFWGKHFVKKKGIKENVLVIQMGLDSNMYLLLGLCLPKNCVPSSVWGSFMSTCWRAAMTWMCKWKRIFEVKKPLITFQKLLL